MPLRRFNREQAWLLPPSLDEMVAEDHPARFVGAFVDELDAAAWHELGVNLDGESRHSRDGVPSPGFARGVDIRVHDRRPLVPQVGGCLL